jgi:hypothetical protein
MTDRELLELAAKAAGIDGVWQDWDGMDIRYGFSQAIYSKDGGHWNPLTHDGDALRLAVTLNMSADFFDDEIAVGYTPNCNESQQVVEFTGDDPYAATRRAIVRAAAEIGKEMK